MVNGIRKIYPHRSNKGFGSKFYVGFQVQNETLEEGPRTHQLKYCRYNNKDEDNSRNILNDKNPQASSQKFGQIILFTSFRLLSSSLSPCLSQRFGCCMLRPSSGGWNVELSP